MILTGYRYKTRLSKNEFSHVDFMRFRPAASFEVFPVWIDYIKKHFPNEDILFFNGDSPIPFEEGAKLAGISDYDIIAPNSYTYDKSKKYHVKNLPKTESNYSFSAIQKQRVESLKFAYLNNLDYLWIDLDCFINSNISSFFKNGEVSANDISNEHMTIDGHFIFISSERLHQWDNHFNIIGLLEDILNGTEDNKQGYKHFLLFEGGLYKFFGYGFMKELKNISIAHASCYKNFVKWLELNPLDTDNYRNLLSLLKNIDKEKLKDYLLEFEDTFEVERV